jgi:plastocyanin
MNIRHPIFVVFALTGSILAGRMVRGSEAGSTVNGSVTVAAPGSTGQLQDASRVVVWLTPIDAVRPVRATAEQPRYRLVQHNKRFEPSLLVVPVGSVVDFPNEDPWFHNVFSLYRGKRFDLGLYQAGAQKSVRFDRIGPSYLFCNIHPQMTGVVLAIDSDLFATTDKSGHYAIPGVLPGKYVMHVWYENATPESLHALQHIVSVQSDHQIIAPVSLKAVRRAPAEHKNKYGQDYDPETVKTDY